MGLRLPGLGTVTDIFDDLRLPTGVSEDGAQIQSVRAPVAVSAVSDTVSGIASGLSLPNIPNPFAGFGGRITLIIFGVALIAGVAHVAGKAVR